MKKKTGKQTQQTRYYISSRPARAQELLQLVRGHWGIENGCHWLLDVRFREDSCRLRKDYAAENMSLIRKVALNLTKKVSSKLSFKKRQTKALVDPKFRHQLIFS